MCLWWWWYVFGGGGISIGGGGGGGGGDVFHFLQMNPAAVPQNWSCHLPNSHFL